MYQNNRANLPSTSNMQGFVNSGAGQNYNRNNTVNQVVHPFPRNDWMGERGIAAEHTASQRLIRNTSFGNENERVLYGNLDGSLNANNFYGIEHISDRGRRSGKRKSSDRIHDNPFQETHPQFSCWETGSSSRSFDSGRHDFFNGSSLPLSGPISLSNREPQEPNTQRHGSMFGSGLAADYRRNALRGPFEAPQRSVRSRVNLGHPQEIDLWSLRNHGSHFQGRGHSFLQQPLDVENFEPSSAFHRRGIALGECVDVMPRFESRISSSAAYVDANSSVVDMRGSAPGTYYTGSGNRMLSDECLSGTSGVSQMPSGTSSSLRSNASWHYPQAPHALHIGSAGSISGLQSSNYPRSLERHSDQNGRPPMRSQADISFERAQTHGGGHNRSMSEVCFS
eukprot:TRINITY_DN1152_c0_g1_i3.p1 TRINITY_DN1152_c0_g1~~TRINITY_DN1152_c0_g1_i3.p1  ORF type:complete len:395 (-),score=70.21 TRINITY_DN1152_c0_g1_i3:709-1893(-)